VVSCCRCTLLVPGGGGGGGVGLLIGRLVGGYSRVRWRSGPLLLLRAVGGRVRDCVPGGRVFTAGYVFSGLVGGCGRLRCRISLVSWTRGSAEVAMLMNQRHHAKLT